MRNTEDLENEVWVKHPIGIMVSSLGRVETARKGKHYGYKSSSPYLLVAWKWKSYYVHRLICEAFNENSNNLPCVNHKDENPRNNRADNLEWCTQKYNANYGTRNERRVKNTDYRARKIDYKAIAEKKSIPILQLNKETMEVVREWKSAHQAQREGGFTHQNICACLKGRLQSAYGFKWVYKKNGEA